MLNQFHFSLIYLTDFVILLISNKLSRQIKLTLFTSNIDEKHQLASKYLLDKIRFVF